MARGQFEDTSKNTRNNLRVTPLKVGAPHLQSWSKPRFLGIFWNCEAVEIFVGNAFANSTVNPRRSGSLAVQTISIQISLLIAMV